MVPRPPPREGQLGFVYAPPIRIQGISVAGEQTVVHIPEFDLVFDIGLCPRAALTASAPAPSTTTSPQRIGLRMDDRISGRDA